MAMTATVIGSGACGNKAAIELIEAGVVDRDHVKLLNTTSKDIPESTMIHLYSFHSLQILKVAVKRVLRVERI